MMDRTNIVINARSYVIAPIILKGFFGPPVNK